MDKLPTPGVVTLDPNDENIILGLPEDTDPTQAAEPQPGGKKEKESLRRSKILLGKAGMLKDKDDKEEVNVVLFILDQIWRTQSFFHLYLHRDLSVNK